MNLLLTGSVRFNGEYPNPSTSARRQFHILREMIHNILNRVGLRQQVLVRLRLQYRGKVGRYVSAKGQKYDRGRDRPYLFSVRSACPVHVNGLLGLQFLQGQIQELVKDEVARCILI